MSASYPVGLYVADGPAFGAGDLVEACVPAPAARLGRERGYLPAGHACDGTGTVLKRVAAVAGDTVAVGTHVSVNGRALVDAPVLAADGAGRALRAAAGGAVAPDHVWLLSTHVPDSFDSRYFGPVPVASVHRRMRALWTR